MVKLAPTLLRWQAVATNIGSTTRDETPAWVDAADDGRNRRDESTVPQTTQERGVASGEGFLRF